MPATASTPQPPYQCGQSFLDTHGRHWEIETVVPDDQGAAGFMKVLLAFPDAGKPNARLIMTRQEFATLVQRGAMRPARPRDASTGAQAPQP
jgi:hypothetical protein